MKIHFIEFSLPVLPDAHQLSTSVVADVDDTPAATTTQQRQPTQTHTARHPSDPHIRNNP